MWKEICSFPDLEVLKLVGDRPYVNISERILELTKLKELSIVNDSESDDFYISEFIRELKDFITLKVINRTLTELPSFLYDHTYTNELIFETVLFNICNMKRRFPNNIRMMMLTRGS